MRRYYAIVAWFARTAFRLGCGLRVTGKENVPRSGRVIVASNHRSNLDPPLLGSTLPREAHFFAKEELFRKRWTGKFLSSLNAFPVRRGRLDRRALSECLRVLEGDGALIFFPEGTRAPEGGFLKAKLGIGWIIWKSRAPVVPVYIHGSTVDEMRLKGRPVIDIVFGVPIAVSELVQGLKEDKDGYQATADRVLERIRDLSLQTPDSRVTEKGQIYDRDIIDDERLR